MRRFLRLFSDYRALEQQLELAASARILAEDDARLWKDRAERAEALRNQADAESAASIKKIANFEAIRSGSPVVPFPEVYTPPAPPEKTPGGDIRLIPEGRRLPRQVQMEAIARSRARRDQQLRKALDALDEPKEKLA